MLIILLNFSFMTVEKISKEQEERLLLYATYTILYLNDTACFAIQQLSSRVPNEKESKKIYGALLKRSREYLSKIDKIVDNKMDYYCDFCTEMDSICDNQLVSFKNALQKAYCLSKIDNPEYFASVESMRSMVDLAVEAGKSVITKLRVALPKVSWLLNYLPVDMLRVANNFANWEYRKIPKDIVINFNEESEVMQEFRKLSECLIDYNSFDKAYRKSIELELKRKNENEPN
jgi:hypothetical protein